jgi:peptidoglycan/LPS O-acetylase OafA/YrhL
MLRSIGAVLVGYLLITASIMIFFMARETEPDNALLLFSIGYGFCVAFAGGFFTAVIAKHHELQHGAALAGIVAILGLATLFSGHGGGPLWYQITNIVCGIVGILCGAFMRHGKGTASRDLEEW